MAKKKRSWLAKLIWPQPEHRNRPRVSGFRNLTVERLETRALLSGAPIPSLSALLGQMTPSPHPSGDMPADVSQIVPLANYTEGFVPFDMPQYPEIHSFVLGIEQVYAGIQNNPDARPAYWGEDVATGSHQYRIHLDDNGMLVRSWTIDWGDGSDPQTVSPQPWVVHQYPAAGEYTISVTAQSADGSYSGDSTGGVPIADLVGIGGSGNKLQVTVSGVPPTLHVAGPQTVASGQTFSLDNLAAFSSQDAVINETNGVTTDYSYSIDWGDGSQPFAGSYVDVINAGTQAPFMGALSSTAGDGPLTHVYGDTGSYHVAVTVTEIATGLSDTQIIPVNVVQLAPTISMSNLSSGDTCSEGTQVGFSSSYTTSPTDPITYNWQITDSAGDTVFQTTDPMPNYTFTAADTYTISLVMSVDNVQSAPATTTVTVNNVAPSFVGTIATGNVSVGQAFNLSAAFTDVNPNDTHTVTVNWDTVGDTIPLDTSAQVTEESSDGSTPGSISDSYTFAAAGTYTIGVTLTDSEGLSAPTQYVTVNVASASVALTDFAVDPASSGSQLQVSYTVASANAAPFNINIYKSSDGTTPDQLLQTVPVTGSALNETSGTSTDTFAFMPQFDDTQSNYHLIAMIDANFTNNTAEFDGGVFYAASVTASPPQKILYVFGTTGGSGDTVHIHGNADSPANTVVLNSGTPYSIDSTITGIHVRGEAGNDTFEADADVTLPLWLFGGSGTSTLQGGSGPNVIVGGSGENTIHSSNGPTTPQTVDDSDTAADLTNYFSDTGSWSSPTPAVVSAFDGNELYHAAVTGTDEACWTFGNLDPTAYYDVYVAWTPITGASTAAQYSVYDNGTSIEPVGQTAIASVNQTLLPADYQTAGTYWHDLGVFQVSSGTLAVQLGTDTSGEALADAVTIVPYTTPPLTNLTFSQPGNGISVDQNGNLSVSYTINGEDAPPFSIGIYGSPDGVQPTNQLQSYEVDDPTLLTGGGASHTVTFSADFDTLASSQYVIAQLDSGDAVEETSKSDNISGTLSGIFEQEDGTLLVLGNATSITGDNVTLTQDLTTGNVTVNTTDGNGNPLGSNTFSGVASMIISTPEGGNAITVDPSVTVPVSAFVGPGSSITGTVAVTDAVPSIANVTIAPTIDKGGIATLTADVGNLGGMGFTVTVGWGLYEGSDTIVYPAGTTSFSMTHHYVDSGIQPFGVDFPVKIDVTANRQTTETIAHTMGVDVPPTVNLTGEPSAIWVGNPITVSAVVADPGEFGTFTYSWSVSGGAVSSVSGATTGTFCFTPNNYGSNYTVSLAVTDADGETVNKSVTIPGEGSSGGGTLTPFNPDVPTVTIQECDADGTLVTNAVEAGSTAYFLVSVGDTDMPHDGTVDVFYHTANGTAVADTDYTATGDHELTFSYVDGEYTPQKIQVNTFLTSNGGTFSVDIPCYFDPDADTSGTATSADCSIDEGLTIHLLTEASNQQDIPVTNDTNSPQTVIVGQWIELFGSYGSLANVQSEGWSDPAWNTNTPDAVAGYSQSVASATVTPLQGQNISSGTLKNLYWTKAGVYTVTYTVTYKDAAGQAQSETATTTFNVVAPSITFSAMTSSLKPDEVHIVGGQLRGGKMQFGEENPGLDGMTWTISGLKVAPNLQGVAKLVQLVAPYHLTGNPLMVTTTNGNYILDNPVKNPALPFLDPVSIQATIAKVNSTRPNVSTKGATDSPYESVPAIGQTFAFARDTFRTYLMYIPTGPNGNWSKSIYVSLQVMGWYWKGVAVRGLNGVGAWQLQSGTGQFQTNPTSQPSSTLPVWSDYGTNFTARAKALPATTIMGTVSDANGIPIAGATVTFTWIDPNVPTQQDRVTISTNANGQYAWAAAFGNANVTVTVNNGNPKTSTQNDRTNNTPLNFP